MVSYFNSNRAKQLRMENAVWREKTLMTSSIITYVILFSAAPEVGSPGVAGDVQHSDSLETGEWDVLPVTLQNQSHNHEEPWTWNWDSGRQPAQPFDPKVSSVPAAVVFKSVYNHLVIVQPWQHLTFSTNTVQTGVPLLFKSTNQGTNSVFFIMRTTTVDQWFCRAH